MSYQSKFSELKQPQASFFRCLLFLGLLLASACHSNSVSKPKLSEIGVNNNRFVQVLSEEIISKNTYLLECQKDIELKNSTKTIKDSTNSLKLHLEDGSSPILTFVQYSY